jgi:hypothetical protein
MPSPVSTTRPVERGVEAGVPRRARSRARARRRGGEAAREAAGGAEPEGRRPPRRSARPARSAVASGARPGGGGALLRREYLGGVEEVRLHVAATRTGTGERPWSARPRRARRRSSPIRRPLRRSRGHVRRRGRDQLPCSHGSSRRRGRSRRLRLRASSPEARAASITARSVLEPPAGLDRIAEWPGHFRHWFAPPSTSRVPSPPSAR